jgi:hypothetical protein
VSRKMKSLKGKLLLEAFKFGLRKGIIFSFTALLLFFNSCATLQDLSVEKPIKEKFSRTYSRDFASFHPQVNSALQEYAQKHKGNSFRIARLGSDGVIIRGYFKSGNHPERFSTEITIKPAGKKKTQLEINFSTIPPHVSSNPAEKASQEILRVIEKGTGFLPAE